MVSVEEIADGLRRLGLGRSSSVIVHSSLKSFGYVDGGAEAVCEALTETCGTVLAPAGTWDLTGIGPPPGIARPHNAYDPPATWEIFDEQLDRATAFSLDLPIDRELGRIPETLRLTRSPARTAHPLFSYIAVGPAADQILAAQRLDWPLGPIEELGKLGGDVLLLGVDHTANTAIHLAEQFLGRSCFYRYAKTADRVWSEFPNIPGGSHEFNAIEPAVRSATRETTIGPCRARRIPITEVIACARQMILDDAAALLCDDPTCRCAAAYQQRA
jgi:aminoglycoside 3-N-acetyltransferase